MNTNHRLYEVSKHGHRKGKTNESHNDWKENFFKVDNLNKVIVYVKYSRK